jgi:short-subunit dehydrogenase
MTGTPTSDPDTTVGVGTVEADASDPEGMGARVAELYRRDGAPGVIIYNAVMGAPDRLLDASVDHLQAAYAVDVVSAIVVAQVAAPAMRAAGFGTMIVTGGGFADHPIPALATISLGKAASGRPQRSSGPTWDRTACEWRP